MLKLLLISALFYTIQWFVLNASLSATYMILKVTKKRLSALLVTQKLIAESHCRQVNQQSQISIPHHYDGSVIYTHLYAID